MGFLIVAALVTGGVIWAATRKPSGGLAVAAAADVGDESVSAAPPAHGRTAKCAGPKPWVEGLRKAILWEHKILATVFTSILTGGYGRKELIAGSAKLLDGTKSLAAGELRLWFNTAANDAVAAWGFATARARLVKLERHPRNAETKHMAKGGVTLAALDGDPITALVATFAFWFLVDSFGTGYQVKLHIMQAIAILLYGGKDVVAVLDAVLQTVKTSPAGTPDGLGKVLATLKDFSDAQRAAEPTPAGG